MSGWRIAGLVICSLLVLDAMVCLLFLDRIEGLFKRMLPGVRIGPLIALEALGGLLGLALLLPGD
jgi:hypothetical protein